MVQPREREQLLSHSINSQIILTLEEEEALQRRLPFLSCHHWRATSTHDHRLLSLHCRSCRSKIIGYHKLVNQSPSRGESSRVQGRTTTRRTDGFPMNGRARRTLCPLSKLTINAAPPSSIMDVEPPSTVVALLTRVVTVLRRFSSLITPYLAPLLPTSWPPSFSKDQSRPASVISTSGSKSSDSGGGRCSTTTPASSDQSPALSCLKPPVTSSSSFTFVLEFLCGCC
ncbi:hypothetical protein PIB30_002446 [Stylosanthes scabra]|uniref:Uncharacterized protein n=1 Tax=Stylosanthes scabra TaxID=79078 RepID=A0ABU6W4C6_9FABA|nr:hypothetical protein [Stylosanthes scabra]